MSNRQLKFRAWDDTKLNWIDVKECSYTDLFEDEKYIVQQFTELYDKNKKPIYEGDRVKFSYTGNHDFYGEVIWLRYSASFGVRTVNASETFAFDDLMDPLGLHEDTIDYVKYLEVIGNIFEHPEFLKNE